MSRRSDAKAAVTPIVGFCRHGLYSPPMPTGMTMADASTTAANVGRPPGVLIFANPYSGSGPNRRYVKDLLHALRARGLRPRVVWDPRRRAAALAHPRLAEKCRCVVAAGGDGSLADVVNELGRAGLLGTMPLATLPIGTENLFAREFGFARDGAALAAAIDKLEVQRVDLGAVTSATDGGGERLFLLMASAGFDADVVHRMTRWRTGTGAAGVLRRVNRLSYLPRIVSCVREYGWPRITTEIDGQRHTGSHLFVFNLPQYGGNLGIARQACGDDHLLDYVIFERPGLVSLATYGLHVICGKHLGRADVIHGKTKRLRVWTETPIAMQADGDPAGMTPVDIEVRPAALKVVATGRGACGRGGRGGTGAK